MTLLLLAALSAPTVLSAPYGDVVSSGIGSASASIHVSLTINPVAQLTMVNEADGSVTVAMRSSLADPWQVVNVTDEGTMVAMTDGAMTVEAPLTMIAWAGL